MKILTKYQLNLGVTVGLLFNVPLTFAEDIDCITLETAIASIEQDFAAFRGARRDLPPDPELAKLQGIKAVNYTRDEYVSGRRLAAATSCSVIVARVENPESIISEARFVCYWPSTGETEAQFAAIRKAVQACTITAQAEEDDADSYVLTIDRVESGEGWGAVSVSADRQSASTNTGASVSVIHTACQAITLGGCDDAN